MTEKELADVTGCLILDDEHAHKLGMGKPLGLGSCRIRVLADDSRVFTGASRYRRWGEPGQAPELRPWRPSPAALERLLRLDLHSGETVGYLPRGGYRGIAIDPADGRNVAASSLARRFEHEAGGGDAAGTEVSGLERLRQLEEQSAREAPAPVRPMRRGLRIWVTVLRVDDKGRFRLRPEIEGQGEVTLQGGGLSWDEGERRQVRVLEVNANGQITKVAP